MSAEPKWMPGPWHVEKNDVGGWTVSDDKNSFGICSRSDWPLRADASAANAQLIAAAPDLYVALAALFARPDIPRLCGFHEHTQLGAAARALNKALGQ